MGLILGLESAWTFAGEYSRFHSFFAQSLCSCTREVIGMNKSAATARAQSGPMEGARVQKIKSDAAQAQTLRVTAPLCVATKEKRHVTTRRRGFQARVLRLKMEGALVKTVS